MRCSRPIISCPCRVSNSACALDYGYHPPTGKDVAKWFSTVLDFAEPYALLHGPVGKGVRSAIGREFRGLWTNVSRADELERIARAIAAKGFWRDGWIGARLTLSPAA